MPGNSSLGGSCLTRRVTCLQTTVAVMINHALGHRKPTLKGYSHGKHKKSRGYNKGLSQKTAMDRTLRWEGKMPQKKEKSRKGRRGGPRSQLSSLSFLEELSGSLIGLHDAGLIGQGLQEEMRGLEAENHTPVKHRQGSITGQIRKHVLCARTPCRYVRMPWKIRSLSNK